MAIPEYTYRTLNAQMEAEGFVNLPPAWVNVHQLTEDLNSAESSPCPSCGGGRHYEPFNNGKKYRWFICCWLCDTAYLFPSSGA